MKNLRSFILSGMLLVAPTASYAVVISDAELSATTCYLCHGPQGKFVGGAIPPLAGYPADIMAQQLKDFKSGKRQSTVMGRHVKGYSDAELEAIAQYFGTLKP